jgi:lipoyl(octanoyl) transferase
MAPPLANGRRRGLARRDPVAQLPSVSSDDEPEWRSDPAQIDYAQALAEMEARAAAVAVGTARELLWLLEHPPVYTAGTSADVAELIDPRFPVISAGRGGRYTYHGPGQRIGYVVLDLGKRGRDVRHFVHSLEGWVIAALGEIGIEAFRAAGRIGIWTLDQSGREAKIGAIGVRVKRWITMHGFSVNLSPDLSHFDGIVPCGIAEFGVTSAAALGRPSNHATFDAALALHRDTFLETVSSG